MSKLCFIVELGRTFYNAAENLWNVTLEIFNRGNLFPSETEKLRRHYTELSPQVYYGLVHFDEFLST